MNIPRKNNRVFCCIKSILPRYVGTLSSCKLIISVMQYVHNTIYFGRGDAFFLIGYVHSLRTRKRHREHFVYDESTTSFYIVFFLCCVPIMISSFPKEVNLFPSVSDFGKVLNKQVSCLQNSFKSVSEVLISPIGKLSWVHSSRSIECFHKVSETGDIDNTLGS